MTKRKTASKPTEKCRILVMHGPNLNLLGTREPEHYGRLTLADINLGLVEFAEKSGVELETFQSNHEGALIERIHAAREQGVRAIIINPAAYTHTSVALRDAWQALAFLSSRCIFRMCMRGSPSASTRTFPTWPLVLSAAWVMRAIGWPSSTCSIESISTKSG